MSGQKRSDTDEMTFAEHIDALRPHLVRGVLAILALAVAAFLCKGLLIDGVLFGPMSAGFPTNRLLVWMAGLAGIEFVPGIERMQLINTAMAGQFNLHLKISMVAASASDSLTCCGSCGASRVRRSPSVNCADAGGSCSMSRRDFSRGCCSATS